MKRMLALVAGLMLALAVLAAGCGGTSSPAEKVDKAITASNEVKSVHADFNMDFEVKGDMSALGSEFAEMGDIKLTVKGGADVDNKGDTPKAKGNVQVEGIDELFADLAQASGESMDTETQLGLNLITSFLEDIQFVVLDEKTYIKVAGTWYDTGDASSMSDVSGMGGFFDMGSLDAENQQCYEDAMKDPSKFGSAQLFSNLAEAGKEDVDGASTTHYTADIDLTKAMDAAAQIARDCGDPEAAGGLEGSQTEIQDMFKKLQVEMWIDGDDNFRKIKVVVEMDPDALSDLGSFFGGGLSDSSDTSTTASGLEAINLNFELRFSQYGADFTITKPEGEIMDLEDLMGAAGLGGSLGLGGGMDGLEGLEDLGGTGTSTTGTGTTGTSTSSFSR